MSEIQGIPAIVEYVSGEKQNDYGPYKSVLFLRSDAEGDRAKVWRSMAPEQADSFQVNEAVMFIPTEKNGKPSWEIQRQQGPQPAPSQPAAGGAAAPARLSQAPRELDAAQKRAIAAYISQQVAIFGYCLSEAREVLPDLSEESYRAIASTLYIAAQRRFGL